MILMTPGRSQTNRRPVPSFGLAMWMGSTKPPATSTSCTFTSPDSLPPGRAHSRSSGLTVDSICGASFAGDGAGLEVAAGEEAQPNAAARHIAEIRFRTRFMVLILPFRCRKISVFRGESRRARNLSAPVLQCQAFAPRKGLREGTELVTRGGVQRVEESARRVRGGACNLLRPGNAGGRQGRPSSRFP